MDETNAHVGVAGAPEDDLALQLAAYDTMSKAAMLALAVVALWRWGTRLVDRMLAGAAADRQAAEARHAALATAQADAIKELGTGLQRVEMAVARADEHNTAAIGGLRQALDRHETRLDRVDGRLDAHGERITGLERGRAA